MTDQFHILSARDHCRLRPNMYLGSVNFENVDRFVLGKWCTVEYVPALLKMVDEHVAFFKPDHILVEKKASGHQLLQELRRRRPRYTDLGQVHYVSVHEWTPPFPPGDCSGGMFSIAAAT